MATWQSKYASVGKDVVAELDEEGVVV
ncbi:MAG: hypothetical protein QOJ74_419, partial [Ilumatobacteraceae bacterium]|nr:hypothetical protein [Ilumatobacteraceae bacterium]